MINPDAKPGMLISLKDTGPYYPIWEDMYTQYTRKPKSRISFWKPDDDPKTNYLYTILDIIHDSGHIVGILQDPLTTQVYLYGLQNINTYTVVLPPKSSNKPAPKPTPHDFNKLYDSI